MDPLMVGLVALGITILLLAIRVPIAAALGISASVGVFIIFSWRPGPSSCRNTPGAPPCR